MARVIDLGPEILTTRQKIVRVLDKREAVKEWSSAFVLSNTRPAKWVASSIRRARSIDGPSVFAWFVLGFATFGLIGAAAHIARLVGHHFLGG